MRIPVRANGATSIMHTTPGRSWKYVTGESRPRPGGSMNKLMSVLLWPAIAIVGAFSLRRLALGRGENVSAVWLVTAASASISSPTASTASSSPTRCCSSTTRADARRAAQRRHGLRADQQVGALRTPLRGDRRRRSAGRDRCWPRRWASSRHAVDTRRRGARRRGAGLHRAVRVGAPRRQVARRDDQDGARARFPARSRWSACSPS